MRSALLAHALYCLTMAAGPYMALGQKQCHNKAMQVNAAIPPAYMSSVKKSVKKSRIDCIAWCCMENSGCISFFDPATQLCTQTALHPNLLRWMNNHLPHTDNVTKAYLTSDVEPPSLLCMLDNILKGKNIGSKGSQLECQLKNPSWVSNGPRNIVSNIQYAADKGSSSGTIVGVPSLNLTQAFTFAVWMKVADVSVKHPIPILEGRPNGCLDWWFWPSYGYDQMLLSLSYTTTNWVDYHSVSKLNRTRRAFWRHLAVTFERIDNFHFYMDGWPIGVLRRKLADQKVSQPDTIELFSFSFRGSIACVTIYERVLTVEEVRTLMDTCP